MATLKQRLHRKNSSGTYDIVHLETSASLVLMSDGTDAETAINSKLSGSHEHAAGDITSGSFGVARGGTGKTTLTSGYALIGAGTSAVTLRAITNNTSTSTALTASTNLLTMNTLRYAINRTTSVAAADTNYTTLMARGMGLVTADTNPSVNGAINWTYG